MEDEAAMEEVNSHIDEAFSILKNQTRKLRKEREAFETMANKLEHVHFSKTLKLNVGGQQFSTSLDTMKKDPGSMLHAMFSGRFETKLGDDGAYFIDRDGTHFRYILNYLRTGRLLLPDDPLIREELLEEAEFYQIEGIIYELIPPPCENSTLQLITLAQRQALRGWLKGTRGGKLKASLIYRGTRDGWKAADFHSRCDRKGPTLVVARSGYNYLFGGYTEQQWDTSATFKKDPHAFLFNLSGPTSGGPRKIDLMEGKEEKAIFCNGSHGPVFGSSSTSGYYDLWINDNPHAANNCSSNLGNSYLCPEGLEYNVCLAGNTTFYVTEMEVYAFEK